jgi:hypothetical protein
MHLQACVFTEEPEAYRIAMFHAETEGMSSFSQFYYSAKYLSDEFYDNTTTSERTLNCQEWQKQLDEIPLMTDIYFILYKVPPDMFVYACREKLLEDVFEENTFIKELNKTENKKLLQYLMFAKAAEYHETCDTDPWRSGNTSIDCVLVNKLISAFNEMLDNGGSDFLKKRCAFQLARLYFERNMTDKCISLYDENFTGASDSTVVEPWTLLFKALSVDKNGDAAAADLLYGQVFSRSDEKKFRCYNAFHTDKEIFNKSLSLTIRSAEKIPVIALACFHNPGPALEKLKEIYALDHESRFLPPLIMREINKLEDWLVTTSLTDQCPSVAPDTTYNEYYNESNGSWEYTRKKNQIKDKLYLENLIVFLTSIYGKSSGDFHDFLSASIAHLYLLDDNIYLGQAYLNYIPNDAAQSILFQKNIDGLLISINSGNLAGNSTKEDIGQQLIYLQKAASKKTYLYKTLYSVVLKLSQKYEGLGNYAMAGLLRNKSDNLKYYYNINSEYGYMYEYYMNDREYCYSDIAYFDNYAHPADIDTLIRIITQPGSSLEDFASNQKLGSIWAYKDLKGTLAFRMDSLELAYKIFSEIPDTFYTKKYNFVHYLNEDPFIPKCWPHNRNFNYLFSKAAFVKRLIELRNDAAINNFRAAEDYLMLGNAYFNCSYWGNSWMMFSYWWSIDPPLFFEMRECPHVDFANNTVFEKPYFECTRASSYFTKVLYATKNPETIARALFMLYECNLSAISYRKNFNNFSSAEMKSKYSLSYLQELCLYYNQTKTFRDLSSNCSTLRDYASALGVD